MEAIGSRSGRASSRYGPTATVFNGPVRKWKKKWVLASSPSFNTSSHSQSNAPKLLLCRWTPIPPSEPDGLTIPPKRKFRYTPIALLEEQKRVDLKSIRGEVSMKETEQSMAMTTTVGSEIQRELNVNEVFEDETQEMNQISNSPQGVNRNHLDLALCLNGPNEN